MTPQYFDNINCMATHFVNVHDCTCMIDYSVLTQEVSEKNYLEDQSYFL